VAITRHPLFQRRWAACISCQPTLLMLFILACVIGLLKPCTTLRVSDHAIRIPTNVCCAGKECCHLHA
jgi:hypothetical protein